MPRPNSYGQDDRGADGLSSSARRSSQSSRHRSAASSAASGSYGYSDESKKAVDTEVEDVDADLSKWEDRLTSEVDDDLFDDPRRFQTLQRVIDVLGLQLIDDAATVQSGAGGPGGTALDDNPAYRDLQRQQVVVEEAIEHMSMMYCADLNGSVIQVGQVARRFNEAVSTVRSLRRQVRDIQETIGATTGDPLRPNVKGSAAREAAANAMSLRELWLKKLECESILSLLNKLDIIRAAPSRFDYLIQPPCRIGAAVLCLSQALATMFSDDVAQVRRSEDEAEKVLHTRRSLVCAHHFSYWLSSLL